MNLELLREFCLELPHATADVKGGNNLCFMIAEKMFFVTGLESTPTGATFKVAPEGFDRIIGKEGFGPAPYMARYKWVYPR